MNPLTITLPLPDRKLHPNGRTANHFQKARLVKKARGDAELAAMAALRTAGIEKPFESATAKVTIYRKRAYRADGDGALSWCKPLFDGFTDAHVWPDDRVVTFLPVVFRVSEDERVEVVVSPIEKEAR